MDENPWGEMRHRRETLFGGVKLIPKQNKKYIDHNQNLPPDKNCGWYLVSLINLSSPPFRSPTKFSLPPPPRSGFEIWLVHCGTGDFVCPIKCVHHRRPPMGELRHKTGRPSVPQKKPTCRNPTDLIWGKPSKYHYEHIIVPSTKNLH